MKRRLRVFFAAIALMSPILGYAQAAGPRDSAKEKIVRAELERRKPLAAQWLSAAEAAAKKSGDPEALRIANYLRSNSLLCAPIERGIVVLESAKSEECIKFVPLVEADSAVSEFWKQQVENKNVPASYSPEYHFIAVRSDVPISDAWKGILLLHEGRHAAVYASSQYDVRDPRLYVEKERETHLFQNRLVGALGGKPYRELLDKEVARLKKLIGEAGLKVGDAFPGRTDYDDGLDTVFGKPLSDQERDIRQSQLWLHASFTLLERELGPSAPAKQSELLRSLYQQYGLLPEEP